jgi:hypothetical protein
MSIHSFSSLAIIAPTALLSNPFTTPNSFKQSLLLQHSVSRLIAPAIIFRTYASLL